jgi:hypothetical protein
MTWTPYADLDALLAELVGTWRSILADDLVGAYLQGSFALGAGDRFSDCDWIVAIRDALTPDQESALRTLHEELPVRPEIWAHHLEGSYAPMTELASIEHKGRTWLFNDHGHPTLEWSDHCNRGYTRWILREHGIAMTGPEPRSSLAPIRSEFLRAEARAAIGTLKADIEAWIDIERIAWGQRYLVITACRVLYTLTTGRVASKSGSLEWASRSLDAKWRPLLGQVRDDRSLGYDAAQRARPGSADAARAFATQPSHGRVRCRMAGRRWAGLNLPVSAGLACWLRCARWQPTFQTRTRRARQRRRSRRSESSRFGDHCRCRAS